MPVSKSPAYVWRVSQRARVVATRPMLVVPYVPRMPTPPGVSIYPHSVVGDPSLKALLKGRRFAVKCVSAQRCAGLLIDGTVVRQEITGIFSKRAIQDSGTHFTHEGC